MDPANIVVRQVCPLLTGLTLVLRATLGQGAGTAAVVLPDSSTIQWSMELGMADRAMATTSGGFLIDARQEQITAMDELTERYFTVQRR